MGGARNESWARAGQMSRILRPRASHTNPDPGNEGGRGGGREEGEKTGGRGGNDAVLVCLQV